MRPVNDEEVLADLDKRMTGYGNGERLAKATGIESARLRSMRSGSEAINRRVAAVLGWELRWVRRVKP